MQISQGRYIWGRVNKKPASLISGLDRSLLFRCNCPLEWCTWTNGVPVPWAQNWRSQGPCLWPTPQLPPQPLRWTGNDVHRYPFSSLGIGNSHLELSPENRRGVVLARTHSTQQHPLQFCECGLSHCPVGAESLWRVYLGVFHGSQFSVSPANLHNTHLLLYFSLLESPT